MHSVPQIDPLTGYEVYQEEVITRLKILGKMDIAEKRLPQDGRASVLVGDR
jgi:type II secretory ATPase GspE/PulE/Tfp pilus assembly ATPase PilB-like protein